jgi:DNA-binding response OmpR family regulator
VTAADRAPDPRPEAADTHTHDRRAGGDAGARRILIIDDDAELGAALGHLLEGRGFEVKTAVNGRAGLEAAASGDFDLVLVDLFMPEVEGFETIRELRERNPKTAIIAMSGGMPQRSAVFGRPHVPDYLAMALKFGAAQALRKPLDAEELVRAIHAAIGDAGAAPDAPSATPRVGENGRVPPNLAELRARFVERTIGDRARIAASVRDLDIPERAAQALTELARITHLLSGAAATFGYPEIGAAAARVANETQGDHRRPEFRRALEELRGLLAGL